MQKSAARIPPALRIVLLCDIATGDWIKARLRCYVSTVVHIDIPATPWNALNILDHSRYLRVSMRVSYDVVEHVHNPALTLATACMNVRRMSGTGNQAIQSNDNGECIVIESQLGISMRGLIGGIGWAKFHPNHLVMLNRGIAIFDIGARNRRELVGRVHTRTVMDVDVPTCGWNTACHIVNSCRAGAIAYIASLHIVQHIFNRAIRVANTQVDLDRMSTIRCKAAHNNSNG